MPNQLPSYYLQFTDENLTELRSDVRNNDPVPADLVFNNHIYDIDIAYRGSYTRKLRKRSYHMVFINPSSFYGAREIHVNAEYNDPSLLRNKLSMDFFLDLGVLAPESNHINLFRNGTRKGVYLQLEAVDSKFLQSRGLPKGSIYYAVNSQANFSLLHERRIKKDLLSGYHRVMGDANNDQQLLKLIQLINTTPFPDFHEVLAQHLNIDAYLRWLVGVVCTMNNDGFTHNYALYRNSETGLFDIIPWDYDATWGRKVSGGIMHHQYVPPEGKISNHLCYLMMRIPAFRDQYRLLLEETLDTIFTVQYIEQKVNTIVEKIRPSVLLDPYLNKNIHQFDQEPELISQFIRDRSEYLKKYLLNL
ncbi:CotH kinase family protein [Sporosarcina sp. GW1-11]|uniref:CotH kinase family protein n=1 Tax=Sporosarcina sp. GW1-11 TaxID=2899126 RepID=UPI00294F0D6B|nr:CotH kinase family protein [Sporosarcina sp. GW1-11]MDV6378109.1 CotH kinase family protein [Sporosarcina sp. GW1-11]